jgi:hypothetical protein
MKSIIEAVKENLSFFKDSKTKTPTFGIGNSPLSVLGGGEDPPSKKKSLSEMSVAARMIGGAALQKAAPLQQQEIEEMIAIKDSAGLKTGKYPKKHVQNLAKAATAAGINPYELIALSLQESNLGTATVRGRRGRYQAPIGMTNDITPAEADEIENLSKQTGIDTQYLEPAIVLKNKLAYGKRLGFQDEASLLQAYNGYGTITQKQMGSDKAYGVPIGNGLDLKKNPLYGKRILALKNDLMNNQDIQNALK